MIDTVLVLWLSLIHCIVTTLHQGKVVVLGKRRLLIMTFFSYRWLESGNSSIKLWLINSCIVYFIFSWRLFEWLFLSKRLYVGLVVLIDLWILSWKISRFSFVLLLLLLKYGWSIDSLQIVLIFLCHLRLLIFFFLEI